MATVIETGRRYVQHTAEATLDVLHPIFEDRNTLATLELQFDTVLLFFVGYRQK